MKTIVQFGICLGPKDPWFMFKRTEGTSDRSVLHIVFVGQGNIFFGAFLSVKLQSAWKNEDTPSQANENRN